MKTRVSTKARFIAAALALAQPTSAQNWGSFAGTPIQVTLLNEGPNDHRVKLNATLAYKDPSNRTWRVEKDFISDGASIPQVFWSFVGGPLDGPYRQAAIVHDKYCETRSARWEDVHLMFYNAMRAAGVSEFEALVLYGGVMLGAPRWPVPQGRGGRRDLPVDRLPAPPPPPATAVTSQDLDQIKDFVSKMQDANAADAANLQQLNQYVRMLNRQ